MPTEDALVRHLRELEESLLQTSVRKSARVSKLLAEGFIEFGSSGRTFTKQQIIASLLVESPVRITATEFRIVFLTPDTALATYRAHRHSEPPVHTLRSSIWQLKEGTWQWCFTKEPCALPTVDRRNHALRGVTRAAA
jgi:hypothetical protein